MESTTVNGSQGTNPQEPIGRSFLQTNNPRIILRPSHEIIEECNGRKPYKETKSHDNDVLPPMNEELGTSPKDPQEINQEVFPVEIVKKG